MTERQWWIALLLIALFTFSGIFATKAFRQPGSKGECYRNCEKAFAGNPSGITRCKDNCNRVWR